MSRRMSYREALREALRDACFIGQMAAQPMALLAQLNGAFGILGQGLRQNIELFGDFKKRIDGCSRH